MAEYDILGRVKRSSVPTEIDSNWMPAGDDNRGLDSNSHPIWLWNAQEYDWKGRVTRKINTDGVDQTTLNDSDVLISYDGCGCAGGQVTTIEGENIIETDWQGNNANTIGRRKQKVYEDNLGRSWKTEILNWDGSTYATNTIQFNGRDQAVSITKTEQSTSVSQVTSMTYDGHGRLKTQHFPIQDGDKHTSYSYLLDDNIESVTDGRGAITNYVYDNNGLVQQINYAVPQNSGISVPTATNFTYDNIGNRTQMTDETGTTSYQYNGLSQLTTETKQFAGVTNSFSIGYEYTLSGQLKTITNPGSTSVTYVSDRLGRLTGVNGQGFEHKTVTWNGNTPTYTTYPINQIIQSIQYRAWGGIKHSEFQDGRQYDVSYNNRLLPYEFVMPDKMSKRYSYYADGNASYAKDLLDNRNDRSFSFDNVGRMTKAYSGYVARNESVPYYTSPNNYDTYIPVKNDYVFNAFDNPTSRKEANSRWFWADIQFQPLDVNMSNGYTNNRAQPQGLYPSTWVYDADGRFTKEVDTYNFTRTKVEYDAAGREKITTADEGDVQVRKTGYYNGNDEPSHESTYSWNQAYDENGNPLTPQESTTHRYYLRSTVLNGAFISLIYGDGTIAQTNIYAAGRKVAEYFPNSGSYSKFIWDHRDSLGVSGYDSSYDQKQYWAGAPNDDLTLPGKTEFAPHGLEIGREPNQSDLVSSGGPVSTWRAGEVAGGWETFDCVWDGVNVPCGWTGHYDQGSGGAVQQAPSETTVGIWSDRLRKFVGIGNYECPNGEACGYYYAYDYNLTDPKTGEVYNGGKDIWFHPGDNDIGPPLLVGGRRDIGDKDNIISDPKKHPTRRTHDNVDPNQCAGIRQLLNEETQNGTVAAANKYSVTFGTRHSNSLNNRLFGDLPDGAGGRIDQDWWMDLEHWNGMPPGNPEGDARFAYSVKQSYLAGKTSWAIGNLVTNTKQTYPIPYSDPGEVAAVDNVINGRKFGDVFTRDWLRKYCP